MYRILIHSINTVLALLIVCALCYAPLLAQTLDSTKADIVQKPRANWYWLHAGWFFVGYEAAASVAVEHHVFKVRHTGMGTTSYASVTPQIYDISLLYGVIERGDWAFGSASVGLGYTYGIVPTQNNLTGTPFSTVGIAWEAHAAVKAYAIGLGFTVLGNLNVRQSEIRYMLTLHFGYLP